MQALKKSDSIFSVAQVVSNVGSPPVVGLLAVIVSIAAVPTAQQMRWGLIYIAVAILLPVAYVFELVRRGKVTDFHLNTRSERFGPFIVTIGAGIIA